MRLLKMIIQVSTARYPECLGKYWIINSPLMFTAIWGIIKAWIDEKTKKKISVIGGNYMQTLL